MHLLAWYPTARRYAVGTNHGGLFAGHADWAPPLGWGPWIVVAAAVAAAYLTWGVRSARALT